jgi:tetratricopeptide (TPR) repeat protein
VAYLANKQPQVAMADLDRTLKLQPGFVDALVARARLHLSAADIAAAVLDLDAADAGATEGADIRLTLGGLYTQATRFEAAVRQYDKWIASHQEETKLASALNERCWIRVMWGRDLEQALADCNAALSRNPALDAALDSRGWAKYRMGKFQESIADFEADLKDRPNSPWSMYGRGLARTRLGMDADGQRDITIATGLNPQVADDVKKYGFLFTSN